MPSHSIKERAKKGSSHGLTKNKARKILRDGSVRGKSLTARQKRFFGARSN